ALFDTDDPVSQPAGSDKGLMRHSLVPRRPGVSDATCRAASFRPTLRAAFMRLTAVTAFLRTASHLLAKRAVCSVLALLAATAVGAQTLPVHLPSAAEPGREAAQ